jgi:hypothetical protein
MQTSLQPNSSEFGCQLAEATELSESSIDQLFLALLLTTLGVFIGANLLLLDPLTLARSARIAAACFALLLIFHALSRQTKSLLWGIVLSFGAVWIVVMSSHQSWLILVLYGGAVSSLPAAIRLLRMPRSDLLSAVLMAAVATATITGMVAYTSFDMLPRLHSGNVLQDTLYHASIAAMIKSYGVVSTGLHGLVATPYHTFSHAMMAGISLLSGTGVLEVYGAANPMLFASLLIFSVTACCVMLDSSHRLPPPLLWGGVCALLALMPIVFGRWIIVQLPFFVSESYVLSLSLFTLGFVLLYKRRLSRSDLILVFLLAAMISKAKASTGLIFAGLWLTRLLFLSADQSERKNVLAAVILTATAVAGVVFDSARAVAGTTTFIEPFSVMRHYSFLGNHLDAVMTGKSISCVEVGLAMIALSSFFIFHFFLPWTVIIQIGRRGASKVLKTPLGVYSLVAVLFGSSIISVFNMGGGASCYFSTATFFIALPGVVALLADWLQRRQINHNTFLIAVAVIICLTEAKGFALNSALHHRRNPAANPFISRLIELRQTSPSHLVLKAAPDILAKNPVPNCAAKPFVFPAVSERAWIGVLEPDSTKCWYSYYGYEQYGLNKQQQQITIDPVLLPEMTIQDIR